MDKLDKPNNSNLMIKSELDRAMFCVSLFVLRDRCFPVAYLKKKVFLSLTEAVALEHDETGGVA